MRAVPGLSPNIHQDPAAWVSSTAGCAPSARSLVVVTGSGALREAAASPAFSGIPERAGDVNGHRWMRCPCARRAGVASSSEPAPQRSRGQGWPSTTPKGLGLDAGEHRCVLVGGSLPPEVSGQWGRSAGRLQPAGSGWASRVRLPGIPSPREGMERCGPAPRGAHSLSSNRGARPDRWWRPRRPNVLSASRVGCAGLRRRGYQELGRRRSGPDDYGRFDRSCVTLPLAGSDARSVRGFATGAAQLVKEFGSMPFVTTEDGTEIFYKDWGTGQPIVFHHGWPLSSDDWDAQMMFFVAARLPRRGARPTRSRAIDTDLGRARHGHLRRRRRGGGRAPRPARRRARRALDRWW